MRHDAKLGLALGLLATGFAVAFCFPRQPQPAAWPEPLTISDPSLDFMPIKAYRAEASQTGSASRVSADSRFVQIMGTEKQNEVGHQASPLPLPIGSLPQEPIAIRQEGPSGPTTREPVPERRVAIDSKVVVKPESPPKGERLKADVPQTYVVQPGDTLTSIAGRMLGNQAKYQQIYLANQNQLSSPDRLQVGMELVIPEQVPVEIPASRFEKSSSQLADTEVTPTLAPSPYSQTAGQDSTRR